MCRRGFVMVPACSSPGWQVDLVFDLHEDFTTVESTIEVRPWDSAGPAGRPLSSPGLFLSVADMALACKCHARIHFSLHACLSGGCMFNDFWLWGS